MCTHHHHHPTLLLLLLSWATMNGRPYNDTFINTTRIQQKVLYQVYSFSCKTELSGFFLSVEICERTKCRRVPMQTIKAKTQFLRFHCPLGRIYPFGCQYLSLSCSHRQHPQAQGIRPSRSQDDIRGGFGSEIERCSEIWV